MTLLKKYPLLGEKVQLYVTAFPSSYLVESGVYNSQSKACNKLDIVQRGDNVGIKYRKTYRVALTTRFALNKVALN